ILNVPPRGLGMKAVERLQDLGRVSGLPLQELLTHPDYLGELPAAAAANVRGLAASFEACRDQVRGGGLAVAVRDLFGAVGYTDGLGKMYKPRADALRRQENVFEFFSQVAEFEERTPDASLHRFLEAFTLMDDNDKIEEEDGEDAVTLMTVHAAKGLEFPVVVLTGMEYGLFPHRRSLEEGTLEEERRLFYVAITRAQDELAVLHADQRRIRGARTTRRMSPFLNEIPADYKTETDDVNALRPASADVARDYLTMMKEKFKPAENSRD
ncbi:MAG: ATP-binding domain-containing protein, partial [Candidatus Pacebacteria bacterium]|nr:ATP-binding domain-containing protein [Candidatus Paceibacterota bacterium]